jgi:hypothetical protein
MTHDLTDTNQKSNAITLQNLLYTALGADISHSAAYIVP